MDTEIRLFYVTCPTQECARTLSHTLLNERLIACANILPEVESLYHWEGRIETSKEVVLILKSTNILSERIIARIESLHPYNTPCILVLPIEKGGGAYVRWLKGSLY